MNDSKMKKALIFLFFLFQILILNGQPLSKKEAYAFSEKLNEVNILSKKGVEVLNKKIEGNNFRRTKRPNLKDGSRSDYTELSVSQLLIFLSQAFGSDFYYRSGILEQNKFISELQAEEGILPLTQEDYEKLSSKVDSLLQNFEGYQIEEAIKNEEDFPEEVGNRTFSMFGFPQAKENDLISHQRSVMGKTCTRTLKDLLAIGLIDSIVYQEVKSKIESYELTLEAFVVHYAADRVVYYEDFKENKLKEVDFIKELNKQGIISENNLALLINDQKSLFNKYDLIKYSENAKIFPLNEYSTNPENGFKEIFEEIKSIIPEFEYTNFNVRIFEKEQDWDDQLIEYRASISFEINGVEYDSDFFYNYKKRDVEEPDTLLNINTEFHKGVNKYLADLNSDYRLYYANKVEEGKGVYDAEEFGLILITEEQFKSWGTNNSDYFLFKQSHDNRFNSNSIKKLITTYEKIGLFNHLSEVEINEGKDCVAKSTISSYESILSCFPKTVVYFDWETGNLENPYEELTLAFSKASRGAFLPTNIVDDFKESRDKKTVNYSFNLEGMVYQKKLEMHADWLDPHFMILIESALKEQNINGKIYYCLDNGQAAGYIFLADEQYQFLVEHQKDLFPDF